MAEMCTLLSLTRRKKKKRFGQPQKRVEESTQPPTEGQELRNGGDDPTSSKVKGLGGGGDYPTSSKVKGLGGGGGDSSSSKVKDGQSSVVQPAQLNKRKQKPGVVVPVKGQKQAPNPYNEGKRARVIVRNLSFKCTNEELQEHFEKCGTVVDVHIPKKATGTRLGFGFVQFENKSQAGMAVVELNGTSVAGRQVAVDWSLPKNMYEARLPAKPVEIPKDENDDDDDDDEEDEAMDVDEEEEDEEPVKKKSQAKNGNPSKSASKQVDNESEDEEEEEDDDDDVSSEDSSSEEEEEEDDSEEEDDDDEDSDDEDSKSKKETTARPERPSDVAEGRTIFIRNIPFSSREENIEELFGQFGDVKYARIVKDRNSGMSKGSAFVQFEYKDGADASLEAAANESEGGVVMEGRQLLISLAVNRETASTLVQKAAEEKKKNRDDGKSQEKDSRNLYLAREGLIRAGTEAAQDVPPGDMVLRTKIAEANRSKLKNQNVFVSSTRLCIHNIPTAVEDKKLRKIMLQAAGDKAAQLTECRIMRDLDRVNSAGQGKSKGFAFCSFSQHTHALAALRQLNNSSTVFGDKKRPIVEFSLENRRALETKQKRLEKSRLKAAKPKPNQKKHLGENGQGEGGNKKKWKKRNKVNEESQPLTVKKQQDKVARSMYQGPLGLPSHSGPKQRHKARPSQQGARGVANKAKPNWASGKVGRGGIKQPRSEPKEKQPKSMNPNKRKRADVDGFDKLVASHKKRIMLSAKF